MSAEPDGPRLWLVRHGATEWSESGRHTGRTDVPLTEPGQDAARRAGKALQGKQFSLVLTSPLSRAFETCRLAGYGDAAVTEDRLLEWDYGSVEGHSTAEMREQVPGWTVWRDGCPGGETVEDVGVRVDGVIERVRAVPGNSLVFAHGHVLRILGARWVGRPAGFGERLLMSTAAISVLGWERETPAIERWNDTSHLADGY